MSPIIGCYTPLIQWSTVHYGSMMCCSKRTITWSIPFWSIELGSCGIVIHWNKNSYLLSLTSIPWLNFYFYFNWEFLRPPRTFLRFGVFIGFVLENICKSCPQIWASKISQVKTFCPKCFVIYKKKMFLFTIKRVF